MQWNIYSGRFSPYCQMTQHERDFSEAIVGNIRSYGENTPWKETNHFSREFLWVALWNQLWSIHCFQHGWVLAERAEALGLFNV